LQIVIHAIWVAQLLPIGLKLKELLFFLK